MLPNMDLAGKIESILFVASKPLSIAQIAKAVGEKKDVVEEAIESLKAKYGGSGSGISILHEGDTVQMASQAANAEVVEGFIKDEIAGELTSAQLETLTVIAYRGPITRPELEQIRGVNCAVILRNLMMRGLVEEMDDPKHMMVAYVASVEALRHMGITATSELPGYEELHAHAHIQHVLEEDEQ